MSSLEFIYKRHSVRKFKEQNIPIEDINKLIEAATLAPSGKNMQNWHFVVINNKEKIDGIAKIIEKKNAEIASKLQDETKKNLFTKSVKYATNFRTAPVVILVYRGHYPISGLDELIESGASKEEIEKLVQTAPGVQNISAALENLMLAAASMGYGTCWMTGQNYAAQEICDYIGFNKEGYYLTALTPIGVPDGEFKSPQRRPIEEVMTIIE